MKVCLNGILDTLSGVAWPSSARAVRCSVKSENEQDLRLQLLSVFLEAEHNGETARVSVRKVQATVGPYDPNPLGYTRDAMVGTTGRNSERRS